MGGTQQQQYRAALLLEDLNAAAAITAADIVAHDHYHLFYNVMERHLSSAGTGQCPSPNYLAVSLLKNRDIFDEGFYDDVTRWYGDYPYCGVAAARHRRASWRDSVTPHLSHFAELLYLLSRKPPLTDTEYVQQFEALTELGKAHGAVVWHHVTQQTSVSQSCGDASDSDSSEDVDELPLPQPGDSDEVAFQKFLRLVNNRPSQVVGDAPSPSLASANRRPAPEWSNQRPNESYEDWIIRLQDNDPYIKERMEAAKKHTHMSNSQTYSSIHSRLEVSNILLHTSPWCRFGEAATILVYTSPWCRFGEAATRLGAGWCCRTSCAHRQRATPRGRPSLTPKGTQVYTMYVDKTIFKSGTVTRSSVTIHVCRFAVPIMCNFTVIGCFAKNSARPSQTIGGQRPRRGIDFCGECECNIWAWCLRETCDAIRDSAISGAARKPLRGPMKINAQRPYCKWIFSLSDRTNTHRQLPSPSDSASICVVRSAVQVPHGTGEPAPDARPLIPPPPNSGARCWRGGTTTE